MLLLVKIVLIVVLGMVTFQDLKEREVSLLLLIVFPILGSFLFLKNTEIYFYFTSLIINTFIVTLLLLIIFFVVKFLFKKSMKESIGLGDILFFFGMGLCLPIFTFLNIFLFSIIFTFIFYLLLKRVEKKSTNTIPLAGGMSLFLCCTYLAHWIGVYPNIYFL